jgi:hypothetical protein
MAARFPLTCDRCPSTTNSRRGRRPDPRLVALDEKLIPLVEEHQPISVRGTFYQDETRGWVPKEKPQVRLIGRRLLKLRREGRIPYPWIVDESRDVYGYRSYGGLAELADDVTELYRRDYWRNATEWVQIWIEKRALTGVIAPVVTDRWGLNIYPCVGQPSETFLYRGGLDIANQGIPTIAYVLTDFDPAGSTILTC